MIHAFPHVFSRFWQEARQPRPLGQTGFFFRAGPTRPWKGSLQTKKKLSSRKAQGK
jgi:hypothetical protein